MSFVRPVSLERIRGMSASKGSDSPATTKELPTDTVSGPQTNRSHQQSEGKDLCQKLINKKLFGGPSSNLKGIKSTLRT